MDGHTYTLKHKIEIKKKDSEEVLKTIEVLELRRPKGKQMRAMDRAEGEVGKLLALVAACAGLTPGEADMLDGEDITAIGETFADFFGVSLPTGGR